jgi:hypothetical protein
MSCYFDLALFSSNRCALGCSLFTSAWATSRGKSSLFRCEPFRRGAFPPSRLFRRATDGPFFRGRHVHNQFSAVTSFKPQMCATRLPGYFSASYCPGGTMGTSTARTHRLDGRNRGAPIAPWSFSVSCAAGASRSYATLVYIKLTSRPRSPIPKWF